MRAEQLPCDGHLLLSPAACQVWHKAARTQFTTRPQHNTGFVPHTDGLQGPDEMCHTNSGEAANARLHQPGFHQPSPVVAAAALPALCAKALQSLQMLSDRLGDLHKFQTGNKLLQLTIDSPCDQSMNGRRLSVAQHTHGLHVWAWLCVVKVGKILLVKHQQQQQQQK